MADTEIPVALLHPGAMGAAVGAALSGRGVPVGWVAQGRGPASRRRAAGSGLTELPDFAALAGCRIVLSVCPPSAAADVASRVAATGFAGIYVDANAISPGHAVALGELFGPDVTVVDGGIVGPPPHSAGTTRLYLSGDGDAPATVADLFDGTPLRAIVLNGPCGQASALKLGFASYNKLTFALAAQSYALAAHHGVDGQLRELAREVLPDTPLGNPAQLVSAGQKAWRWEGEMTEIAAAVGAADLAPELVAAVGELFARWREHRDDADVTVAQLLAALRLSAR
ncbi:NAD(P)-dependent oxidoreductase [Amycolatopsis jiangsuensis]|uniref:3-hydroxyisobutyrate dehydrogenase-like beta-hydroxyacid dehydrogenase n=1 Tax=Amycolatopsis jiangsuensis TaxID=1181879 RepID=A0A840IQU0_9PSEU|nr:NAD(P)-dependent oxidoreductase [Amycolatopsis jiangsuensis]MBB4684193.1 3-hydroxyisobutyrate dehydrogenase-like beta-hydroxyacid dehydrogenase [Amycolatopsis jiangsuensis]